LSTLYLNASIFPAGSTGVSSTPLTIQVFLASKFLNPPTGFTAPPGTPDGSVVCDPTGNITGLDDTKDYWLICYNPQGYIHWFQVDWSSGNTSEAPLNITVPLVEGVQQGIAAAMGSLAINTGGT
jgi:hypothetical protein